MTNGERAYRVGHRWLVICVLGAFCATPAALFAFLVYRSGPPEGALLGLAICLAVGVWLFWEPAVQASVRLTPNGVRQLSVRGWRVVRWSEVYRVQWSGSVIRLSAPGQRVRINPRFFKDPAELKRILRTHVPPQAFMVDLDDET